MRNCDKMKNGVLDYKINEVKEKIARRDASLTIYRSCPDGNHPHLIDLGLPSGTKWACCNVDAKNPEDYGGYYAWGETTTKSEYSWSTYKHCDGTKESCHNLGKSISGTQYDVAHVKWGGSWQLPTDDQIYELKDECKHVWVIQNGVKGRKFTGPNGASIFLPAAGSRWGTDFGGISGSVGYYLSGNSSSDFAHYLLFNSDNAYWSAQLRCLGRSVRPVSK